MTGKALMTQYAEGLLISRELNDMMTQYAADARFERDMIDDVDLYGDRKAIEKYGRDKTGLIKEGLTP